MNKTAHAESVPNGLGIHSQHASHEKVTREKGFDQADDASPGSAFDFETGMKDLQVKATLQIPGGNMLVLGLRPSAIPS